MIHLYTCYADRPCCVLQIKGGVWLCVSVQKMLGRTSPVWRGTRAGTCSPARTPSRPGCAAWRAPGRSSSSSPAPTVTTAGWSVNTSWGKTANHNTPSGFMTWSLLCPSWYFPSAHNIPHSSLRTCVSHCFSHAVIMALYATLAYLPIAKSAH